MRTVGLITEYNPFHNGHAWHMQEAKRLSGADFCIVVMSGNFVQRGAPAILDKYSRAEMALACGADLVLELPVPYALGSAEYFASGAVSLLDRLGIVDTLCFGSECGNIDTMLQIARILNEEPEEYRNLLKENLKSGKTFPLARAKALAEYSGHGSRAEASILQEPNNILGIEYLKALFRLKSRICPVTIMRTGGSYHSDSLNETMSSATAIRKILCAPWHLLRSLPEPAHLLTSLENEMPDSCFEILKQNFGKSCPVQSSDFSLPLHYRLLSVSSPEELSSYQDVSSELADRIFHLIPSFVNLDQFAALVKSKQYTESRIRRCLYHILLDIRSQDTEQRKQQGWNGYARVLGFRKESSVLLGEIKRKSSLPLVTKLANAKQQLDAEQMSFLKKDIFASEIYQSIVTSRFGQGSYNEYRQPVIVYTNS